MKHAEAVLVSAYTGVLLAKNFADVQMFRERLLERPIFTHEFGDEAVQKRIREKCRPYILNMIEGETK